jgi:hypothetical protein
LAFGIRKCRSCKHSRRVEQPRRVSFANSGPGAAQKHPNRTA